MKLVSLERLGRFLTKVKEWANNTFVPKTRKINGHDLTSDVTLTPDDIGAIAKTEKGVANGVAALDENGTVPAAQLPSYVDDIVEGYLYNSKFYEEEAHTTEITSETSKIYVDLATNNTFRWSGTQYTEVSKSLALGETASTAFRGDLGKIAYDHSQVAHAPANAQKNVQADWAEVDDSSDAFIKNKPTVFTGATADAGGTTGFVPSSAAGDQTKYLRADGTWANPTTDLDIATESDIDALFA